VSGLTRTWPPCPRTDAPRASGAVLSRTHSLSAASSAATRER
jgi:hypothetical protein